MNNPRPYLVFLLVVVGLGCRGERQSSRSDSAVVSNRSSAALPVVRVNPGWQPEEAGPFILLSNAENTSIASLIFPSLTDSMLATGNSTSLELLSGVVVDLFDRTGFVGSAKLGSVAQSTANEGCLYWPMFRIDDLAPRQWHTGFKKGFATALRLDSLEGLTIADSLLVTTELARLTSAVSDTGDTPFRGLPFVVRKAYRTELQRDSVLIGDVVRKINEEANPREEHTLIIAERSVRGSGHFETVFFSRAAGSEEMVRTNEILAAVRFISGGNPAIVVSFEYENGGRVALIERTGRAWRITWRSAYSGC